MPEYLSGSLSGYLEQLASGEATPGGGSAAAVSGSMAAALLAMSARFTVGRERYVAFEESAAMVLRDAEAIRPLLQRLIEEDAVAYDGYRAASAMPKATEAEKSARRQALQAATRRSAEVPMEIVRLCARLLELADALADRCNPYLVSDVVVATRLAVAAVHSALINVRINLASLEDPAVIAPLVDAVATTEAAMPALAQSALRKGHHVMQLPYEGDQHL